MTTITRHIICHNCETCPLILVTQKDDTGREYIVESNLQAIDREQAILKVKTSIEYRRDLFKKQHPEASEEEIEPHYNCVGCGTSR